MTDKEKQRLMELYKTKTKSEMFEELTGVALHPWQKIYIDNIYRIKEKRNKDKEM